MVPCEYQDSLMLKSLIQNGIEECIESALCIHRSPMQIENVLFDLRLVESEGADLGIRREAIYLLRKYLHMK